MDSYDEKDDPFQKLKNLPKKKGEVAPAQKTEEKDEEDEGLENLAEFN